MNTSIKVQGDNRQPPNGWVNPDPTFTILVKESGKRIEGIRVDIVNEQKDGNSSIILITKAAKKWKMQFHEFSFVFPATAKAA